MKVIVIGGGGHASVVIDAAYAIGGLELVGVIDTNSAMRGTRILDVPVIGSDDDLPRLRAEGIESFIIGLGHSRRLGRRTSLFKAAIESGLSPINVIHPRACIAPSARLGRGIVALAGATVNVQAAIYDNVILNTASIVEHHCEIGAHSHLAPQALLCGAVKIGEEVMIGAGAVVREGLAIGTGTIVGMGAIVLRNIEARSVVGGNPARSLVVEAHRCETTVREEN
jgi:sugar O-acyltransferase (sialic acid O-acetyltransferase NeuD family)